MNCLQDDYVAKVYVLLSSNAVGMNICFRVVIKQKMPRYAILSFDWNSFLQNFLVYFSVSFSSRIFPNQSNEHSMHESQL